LVGGRGIPAQLLQPSLQSFHFSPHGGVRGGLERRAPALPARTREEEFSQTWNYQTWQKKIHESLKKNTVEDPDLVCEVDPDLDPEDICTESSIVISSL